MLRPAPACHAHGARWLRSIDRRDAIEPAFAALLGVVDEVFPVEREDVERARRLLMGTALSARDAVHAAIMRRHGISRILTFDRSSDALPGIQRN
jgi:uncharacterized protein